jgi:hypothetical protein
MGRLSDKAPRRRDGEAGLATNVATDGSSSETLRPEVTTISTFGRLAATKEASAEAVQRSRHVDIGHQDVEHETCCQHRGGAVARTCFDHHVACVRQHVGDIHEGSMVRLRRGELFFAMPACPLSFHSDRDDVLESLFSCCRINAPFIDVLIYFVNWSQ